MRNIRATVIGLGFKGYSDDAVGPIVKRVQDDLASAGVETTSSHIVMDYEDGLAVTSAIRAEDSDLLLGVVASWCDARGAMPVLTAYPERPLLLYSTGGRTRNDGVLWSPAGGAGAPGLLEPLRAGGRRFRYVYEKPDEGTRIDALMPFCRAARAISLLRGTRLGTVGYGDMGLYTTAVDTAALRRLLHLEIVYLDLMQVETRAHAVPDGEVESLVAELAEQWSIVGPKPSQEDLAQVARTTLALRELIAEHRLTTVSLKCVEGFMTCMRCAACMVGTLVGDETFYVCENDIPGMVAHAMLHYVSGGETASFVESYEFWDDRVLFGVCGFAPPSMMRGARRAKVFKTAKFDGLMAVPEMKVGRVTLCRPFWREGRMRMHIVTGEAVEPRSWVEIGFELPKHPSFELVLDGIMQHFLDHVPSQHYSFVYGDHADALTGFCEILGVEAVRT
jgi:L-fucose isomerase-like protein